MINRCVKAIPRILYSFLEIKDYLFLMGIPNNTFQSARWLKENGWVKTTKKVKSVNIVLYYKVDENGNNVELDFPDLD